MLQNILGLTVEELDLCLPMFRPHIHIHDAIDDTRIIMALTSTYSNIYCFNYVFGKENKIVVEFGCNSTSSAIVDYSQGQNIMGHP